MQRFKPLPAVEVILSVFNYEPETGKFYRKNRLLSEAGGIMRTGYRSIAFNGELYMAHRLAWKIVHGVDPAGDIDHINRDKADNRIINLRECVRFENCQNQSLRKNNSSGVKGVHWNNRDRRWIAKANVNGKYFYLGSYLEKEKAIEARNSFTSKKYNPEFYSHF